MLNTQLPEPRATGDGTTLDVHSIFHTIQGEGPFSGVPAVFVRLAGCNLQCVGCDTDYTKGREPSYPIEQLLLAVVAAFPLLADNPFKRPRLVVITGGEPFRQNIAPFCKLLLQAGAMVQIETNGTYSPGVDFPQGVKVVCSPKAGKVAPPLLPFITAYKYVVEAERLSPGDGLPLSIIGLAERRPARPHASFQGPVYVTPMDDPSDPGANERNRRAAVLTCLTHGYIFQMQMHKLVGLL